MAQCIIHSDCRCYRPRQLSGSVVAAPGFCFQSATRRSGNPRLSLAPETVQAVTLEHERLLTGALVFCPLRKPT